MFAVIKKWLVILTLTQCVVYSYGQAPTLNFKTIDNTSGLPNNFINDIEMDSLGFLWIGTTDGLCRYDSPSQVQVYKTGQIGLESNHITVIRSGQNNKLWIGTNFGGVTMYDIEADTSRTYNDSQNDEYKLTSSEILSIYEIDSTEIWIGTENGLNVLYPENDSIYHFPISPSDGSGLDATAILDIYKDQNGWIWVGTWSGSFYLYTPSKSGRHNEGKFRKFSINGNIEENVWQVSQDSRGIYWIATHDAGVQAMLLPDNASNDPSHQEWEPAIHSYTHVVDDKSTLTSNYVFSLEEDDDGNLWMSGSHGLNILRASETEKLLSGEKTENADLNFERHYQNAFKNTLANNLVKKIYKDKQGIMWLGTISGLNQYNWYTNQFNIVKLPTSSKEKSASEGQLINSIILQDENTLLLASHVNGIMHYCLKEDHLKPQDIYTNPKYSQRISVITQAKDKLYLGTINGISIYDKKTKRSKDYDFISSKESENATIYISYILKDSKNRLWVATEQGLVLVDEEKGAFTWYTYSADDPTSISDNSISQIFEDSQQNIWMTTFNGINLVQENNGLIEFITYKKNKSNVNIPTNQVTAINEFNGRIYFGCRSGLFTYDLKTKEFEILNSEKIKHNIHSILISKEGILWASTSEGVLRYELNSNEFKLYDKNDGVTDLSLRSSSGYIGENGEIFFGGNKIFIQINDAELKKNDTKPEVHITGIKTISPDNELSLSGIKKESITIPSNNYYLALNFTSLNYSQAENNQYKYKLQGFTDEDWKTTNTQQAVYTNLDAGRYTFKVIASNNEGFWNDEGATLDIIVKPAMVETIWFKILVLLLSLLFGWLAFLLYTKNIRNRNELLEEYNEKLNSQVQKTEAANTSLEEREKYMKVLLQKLEHSNDELLRSNKDLEEFAYAASHDMKEPLRTVGTFTDLLNRKYNDKLGDSGKEYIDFITQGVDRMSELINSLLSYSQVGKKDIEFQHCDLNEVVNAKIKDLSQIIAEKNATIICNSLPTLLCAGHQIGMVFYNLVLNGIKFNKSEKPKIEITAIENASHWAFTVKDNGIGIPEKYQKQIFEIFKRLHNRDEYEGTGIGLALSNKIIHRHNGRITVESKQESGTTFTFTISKNIKLREDTTDIVSKTKET